MNFKAARELMVKQQQQQQQRPDNKVLLEGHAFKMKKRLFHLWKKRYLVLTPAFLFVYKTMRQRNEEELGEGCVRLSLDNLIVRPSPTTMKHKHSFDVFTNDYHYVFAVLTQTMKNNWIQTIQQACYHRKATAAGKHKKSGVTSWQEEALLEGIETGQKTQREIDEELVRLAAVLKKNQPAARTVTVYADGSHQTRANTVATPNVASATGQHHTHVPTGGSLPPQPLNSSPSAVGLGTISGGRRRGQIYSTRGEERDPDYLTYDERRISLTRQQSVFLLMDSASGDGFTEEGFEEKALPATSSPAEFIPQQLQTGIVTPRRPPIRPRGLAKGNKPIPPLPSQAYPTLTSTTSNCQKGQPPPVPPRSRERGGTFVTTTRPPFLTARARSRSFDASSIILQLPQSTLILPNSAGSANSSRRKAHTTPPKKEPPERPARHNTIFPTPTTLTSPPASKPTPVLTPPPPYKASTFNSHSTIASTGMFVRQHRRSNSVPTSVQANDDAAVAASTTGRALASAAERRWEGPPPVPPRILKKQCDLQKGYPGFSSSPELSSPSSYSSPISGDAVSTNTGDAPVLPYPSPQFLPSPLPTPAPIPLTSSLEGGTSTATLTSRPFPSPPSTPSPSSSQKFSQQLNQRCGPTPQLHLSTAAPTRRLNGQPFSPKHNNSNSQQQLQTGPFLNLSSV
ncbi:hypothetical protein QOT17_008199 [Balamuthia mandrillaris]